MILKLFEKFFELILTVENIKLFTVLAIGIVLSSLDVGV
jgi:hypothetical protein